MSMTISIRLNRRELWDFAKAHEIGKDEISKKVKEIVLKSTKEVITE